VKQGCRATIMATSVRAPFAGCIIKRDLNLPLHLLSLPQLTMFRTAARSFAASAWRRSDSILSAEARQTAVNISQAQGIGQRGFLDGNNSTHNNLWKPN
jgi:hypothetical protein